jgi:hypothetical protein
MPYSLHQRERRRHRSAESIPAQRIFLQFLPPYAPAANMNNHRFVPWPSTPPPTRLTSLHSIILYCTTTTNCANITAHTPPPARSSYTQHGLQHTPPTEEETQSHMQLRLHIPGPRRTHPRSVRSPSDDGMLPESWLFSKFNSLQDTRTVVASHPTPLQYCCTQSATRNASQLIN